MRGLEDCQNNERLGTQQVKLRSNRRGVALPGWSFSCVQLKGITILKLYCIVNPSSSHLARAHAAYEPWGLVRSRSSFEATAEEWLRGLSLSWGPLKGINHRACYLTASQNHTLTVSYSHGPKLLRALCLASGTAEIRPGYD